MNKLTAILVGCMLITGAFVSCGSGSKSSAESSGDIVGTWKFRGGSSDELTFNSDGTLGMDMDYSYFLSFTSPTEAVFHNDDADVTFDGTTCTVELSTMHVCTLTRISGETDKDDLDGRYVLSEMGLIELYFPLDTEEVEAYFDIDGDTTRVVSDKASKYSISGDKLTVEINEEEESSSVYKIDGDTMTIYNEELGMDATLYRVKPHD